MASLHSNMVLISTGQLDAAVDKHRDAPSHWFGVGKAPNFSRRVAQAAEAVTRAEKP